MGSARFDRTSDFARYKADAVLRCRACRREVRLTSLDILKMFPMPLPLSIALKKLKCRECGTKEPRLAPVPRQL